MPIIKEINKKEWGQMMDRVKVLPNLVLDSDQTESCFHLICFDPTQIG